MSAVADIDTLPTADAILPAGGCRSASPPALARLLGPAAWARLHPQVRARIATQDDGRQRQVYRGAVQIRVKAIGWLFVQLSRLVGAGFAPAQSRNLMLTARVGHSAELGGVVWERTYHRSGRQVMAVRSCKIRQPDGRLEEHMDRGMILLLDVQERAGGLLFRSTGYVQRLWRWRVPVPAVLTPGRLDLTHHQQPDGRFRVVLSLHHPWFGEIFRQDGAFEEIET